MKESVVIKQQPLDGRQVWDLLCRLDALHPDFTVLHELKNSEDLAADLRVQRASLH